MKKKFNPFTGTFDFVGGSSINVGEVIHSILLDSNQDIDLPVASIIFDNDSILYNNDEEL